MNQKQSTTVGVGVLTVMTILLVLTLAVFAALTFASARADMALSQINAETVTDFYAADARAAEMAAEFWAGAEMTFQATIPVNDAQSLYIQLERALDGTVRVVAWRTLTADGDVESIGDPLPVWDGKTLPTD